MRPLPRGSKLLYIVGEKNVELLRYRRSALCAWPTLIGVGRKVQKFGGFGAGAGPQRSALLRKSRKRAQRGLLG